MLKRTALTVSLSLACAALARADVPSPGSFSGSYLATRAASHWLDLDATIKYAKEALKTDPKNTIITEELFLSSVLKGDLEKAEALAPTVVKNNPRERTAQLVLGLKEMRAKDYGMARGHFQQAAYTPFGVLTASLLSAWTFAGEGNLNAALRELDKLDTQSGFANYKALHVALITELLAGPVRAEPLYKRSYSLAPTSLRVTQAYGNFLERLDRKPDAEKVYRAYLQNDPNNIFITKALGNLAAAQTPQPMIGNAVAGAGEVLFSVASSLGGEQNAEAGLTFAQLALPEATDKDFVLTTIAGDQAALKQYEDSIATYEKISADSLLRDYADIEIALNLQRLKKSDEAIARLNAVVARNPKDPDAYVTLGGVQRTNNHYQEAIDAYTKALGLLQESQPQYWRVLYDRGISYDHEKQYDKSEADFRKALALSHDDAQVLNYLGYSMIDRGVNLDEALGMVRKAVSLKPDDGYITDSLGWAYYKLNNLPDATSWCEHAVELLPSDPTIAQHLGDVYWRVGRELEARFQWQHALDNHPDEADVAAIKDRLQNGLPPVPAVKPADNAPTQPNKG